VSRVKTIRSRGGHEVEVVVRPPRKRQARESQRPMFGGPESVIGERVQKDLDNALMYASLDALMTPKGG
jgi:hypothetical protein